MGVFTKTLGHSIHDNNILALFPILGEYYESELQGVAPEIDQLFSENDKAPEQLHEKVERLLKTRNHFHKDGSLNYTSLAEAAEENSDSLRYKILKVGSFYSNSDYLLQTHEREVSRLQLKRISSVKNKKDKRDDSLLPSQNGNYESTSLPQLLDEDLGLNNLSDVPQIQELAPEIDRFFSGNDKVHEELHEKVERLLRTGNFFRENGGIKYTELAAEVGIKMALLKYKILHVQSFYSSSGYLMEMSQKQRERVELKQASSSTNKKVEKLHEKVERLLRTGNYFRKNGCIKFESLAKDVHHDRSSLKNKILKVESFYSQSEYLTEVSKTQNALFQNKELDGKSEELKTKVEALLKTNKYFRIDGCIKYKELAIAAEAEASSLRNKILNEKSFYSESEYLTEVSKTQNALIKNKQLDPRKDEKLSKELQIEIETLLQTREFFLQNGRINYAALSVRTGVGINSLQHRILKSKAFCLESPYLTFIRERELELLELKREHYKKTPSC